MVQSGVKPRYIKLLQIQPAKLRNLGETQNNCNPTKASDFYFYCSTAFPSQIWF
jgi:hypothetical protein